MATWIKFETTTPDKPEVIHMAERLGIDQDAVIGKLLRVWVWADANSIAGSPVAVTSSFLDRLTACPGFAVAMREAGWLEGRDAALSFPSFDRHNGQTAKARAETNRRVANHRQRHEKARATPHVTSSALQKALPEKRREEQISAKADTPVVPEGTDEKPDFALGADDDPRPRPNKAWKPSPEQLCVGSWFHRRPEIPWSAVEQRLWRKIYGSLTFDELAVLEAYYTASIPKGQDYRRHDLGTLLTHWPGELDRARKFKPPEADVRAF